MSDRCMVRRKVYIFFDFICLFYFCLVFLCVIVHLNNNNTASTLLLFANFKVKGTIMWTTKHQKKPKKKKPLTSMFFAKQNNATVYRTKMSLSASSAQHTINKTHQKNYCKSPPYCAPCPSWRPCLIPV